MPSTWVRVRIKYALFLCKAHFSSFKLACTFNVLFVSLLPILPPIVIMEGWKETRLSDWKTAVYLYVLYTCLEVRSGSFGLDERR